MGMKFDGKTLKDGSKTIANVKNDRVYEGTSSSKTLANYKSNNVYEGTSSSRKLNKFDGFRGALSDWALWYLFCK